MKLNLLLLSCTISLLTSLYVEHNDGDKCDDQQMFTMTWTACLGIQEGVLQLLLHRHPGQLCKVSCKNASQSAQNTL
jgi:hypothetical protein